MNHNLIHNSMISTLYHDLNFELIQNLIHNSSISTLNHDLNLAGLHSAQAGLEMGHHLWY